MMSNNHLESNGHKMYRNDLNITTLFFKPMVGKLRYVEVRNHFRTFGDVKNVRIRYKPTIFGFVTFAQAESAAKALKTKFHTIDGRKVKVAVAHDKHQDDTTIKNYLLELNDECIFEILSKNCLSPIDLSSIAEVSPRLKDIAVRVFRSKYKTCEITLLSHDQAESAKQMLQKFGSLISDLKIRGWYLEKNVTSVLDFVIKYCTNTLESVYLRYSDYLESVILRYTDIPTNITTRLRPMSSLKTLKFDCQNRKFTSTGYDLIHLNFIENLTFERTGLDSQFFQALSQLHRLQTLEFRLCTGLKYLRHISNLQLTKLKIVAYDDERLNLDVVYLLQRLSNLKYLSIDVDEFSIDLRTYLAIVGVVRKRPDNFKLTIELYGDISYKNDDVRRIFEDNAHIVEVKITC